MRAFMTFTDADTDIESTVTIPDALVKDAVIDAAENQDVNVWHYGIVVRSECGAILHTMTGNANSPIRLYGDEPMTDCDSDCCHEVDMERAYLEADGS